MCFEFIAKENGGYNDGDPPLPIPNREVKPISADDTAIPSGKVGSRQLCETFRRNSEGLFFVCMHSCLRKPGLFIEASGKMALIGGYRLAARLPDESRGSPEAQPPTL